MKSATHPRCAGGASVVIILILAFTLALLLASTHVNLLFEQRTSANHYRATQAFEAAQAGLDWALAQLNEGGHMNDHCLADPKLAAGQSFKERYADAAALNTPRPAPFCQHREGRWSCQCAPTPTATAGDPDPLPLLFTLHLAASAGPDLLKLTSTGCVLALPEDCVPSRTTQADARSQLQLTLARIPSLSSLPSAALTVRGAVHLDEAPWQLDEAPSLHPGLALHSGADISAPDLQVQSAPGAPAAPAVVAHDAQLRRRTADQLFASLFRMDKPTWQQQPSVRQLRCTQDCSQALVQTIGRGVTHPMVWLEGGLHLRQALTLGSPSHPVLLISNGPIRFEAPVVIHGVVYGTSTQWDTVPGTTIHGAVVLEGSLQGRGMVHIRHDRRLLKQLQESAGTYARVAGSWSDF